MSPGRINAARCEPLVVRAAGGDEAAWQELVLELWPSWLRMVRSSPRMRGLGRSEDHVRNVVANLVEKLGGVRGHGLDLYQKWRERHPDKAFDDWIRIITANAERDYVCAQMGDAATVGERDASVNRLLNDFGRARGHGGTSFRPAFTAARLAQELIAFARSQLPEEQIRALSLWIEGADFEDIEGELGLEGKDGARKLVRAAVAVLRRHFAPAEGSG